MTPEPRLNSRRLGSPSMSSPKKYWKKGSFAYGELGRSTYWSDEMFVTARTVCAATPVKSGPATAAGAGGAGAAAPGPGPGRECATAGVAGAGTASACSAER